ncbi:MAG: hypothetical protein CBC25_07635 [Pelagibacteraceae bacterium TMED65]|jgi:hypothetical protein|nr:MAG: hypothetical protein CBC25_07635 [Pelagibacteraceae bacterium TMED65]|tara:strand:+ start:823 stop:1149 length:327 start_codon:yes stop_codon:yes gene_type:complete
MKIKIFKKPRLFQVNQITIKDFGKIKLKKNEMVSFVTKSKKEYDFTAKDWGFYVTQSINGRLKKEGFKIVIVKNKLGKFYVMAVEKEKIKIFKKFCLKENKKIIKWLG